MVAFSHTLSEAERVQCVEIATARHTANRKRGTFDNKVDKKRDPLQLDREGLAGEMIFAALTGLPVDFDTSGPIPKHDFFAADGSTIDIKTTRHFSEKNGYLLADLGKAKPSKACDWYGLVHCDWPDPSVCPTGIFLGGVHRLYLFDTGLSVRNLGYGSTFAVHWKDLMPPAHFLRLAQPISYGQDHAA